MSDRDRDFDVVLYGATGFTGRQTARRLRDGAEPALRWAIAGRNRSKLEQLKSALDLPRGVGVIEADSGDPGAVAGLARATRVLLTTAGPYALYGEPLLAACVHQRTDYLDISGETPWVRDMIDRYHQEAARSGVKVVPCCGFASVPSDLGALLAVEALRRRGQGCRQVRAFFATSVEVNGGSVQSVLNLQRSGQAHRVRDPFLLAPGVARSPDTVARSQDPVAAVFDSDLGAWVAPYFLGAVNTRVVRRSEALSAQWQEGYGPGFIYQEFLDAAGPASWLTASAVAGSMAALRVLSLFPAARELAAAFAPKAGTGPSERQMEEGFFRCRLVGMGDAGARVWVRLADRGDPANRVTARILCEAALALATQRDELPGGPDRGGILTPATGLGGVLVERLRRAGMTLEVE